jgi:membrane associated rhomboid family serine protease
MLIPLRHESMQGRRWPIITIGLIALNTLFFLLTHEKIEEQSKQEGAVKVHVLMLAARHPELKMRDDLHQFVEKTRNSQPKLWKYLQNPSREAADSWDAGIPMRDDSANFQSEMDTLASQFEQMEQTSILDQYAFFPGQPKPISYLTANFLHGGWLHLIGNMWFLWLAGFILEDTWGRLIYPAFYLLAGAFAMMVHAWSNPGSMVATLGASGAVAGLMGAFLARFPNMKIEMAWIWSLFFLFRMRAYKFKAAAYWLLPIWLFMEVFYGSLFGASSGVAHWAHVGGFVFGTVVGYGIRASGLEHVAEKGIQEKISWVSHPLLADANEQMEKGELDLALANLQKLIAEKPDSIDAYRMLQQVYWQKNDHTARRAALETLCGLLLKAKDTPEALQTYEDFKNVGGERLPASLWLDLCRLLEDTQDLARAVNEYQALAAAYPVEKQSLLAQMAAGRLCLKRLNDAQRAYKFYQAAASSPIPHLDWDANIKKGTEEAQKALAGSTVPVSQGARGCCHCKMNPGFRR